MTTLAGMWTYLLRYYAHMLGALWGHAELLGLTLLFGVPIAVGLSFLVYRFKFLNAPVMVLLEILYTIPSLAFFALLIPFSGLGAKTAIIVLTCYALFFLVRNFVAGLEGIDPAIVEAGRAVGYSSAQLFTRVELPLALPQVVAGVRMAAVSTTGIACIAYAIGAGGIGTILFEGMRQMSYVKILWGALLAIALSVIVNNALLLLQEYCTKKADPGRVRR